jgi:hypothetical protein
MTQQGTNGGRHRVRLDRYGQLAGALLSFAVAMAINLATDDFGYPGLITMLMVTAVFATAAWLRRLPQQAPLARHASGLLLIAAGVAVVISSVVPAASDWGLVVAVALTALAVLLTADLRIAGVLLGGASAVGLGLTAVGIGASLWAHSFPLLGGGTVAIGLALVGLGTALWHNRVLLFGAATALAGLVLIASGIAVAVDVDDVPIGGALINLGLASIVGGLGTALGSSGYWLKAAGFLSAGVAFGIAGLEMWMRGHPLLGAAIVGFGVIQAGGGIGRLRGHALLSGMAHLGLGVLAIAAGGAAWTTTGFAIVTAAIIVLGIGSIIYGYTFLTAPMDLLRRWWARLVTDPS